MRHRTKHNFYLSKTYKGEIFIARISLPIILFLILLFEISLGSRTHNESQGYLERTRTSIAAKIRGWEKISGVNQTQFKNDGRSNAGFHIQWPQSLVPPEFDISNIATDRFITLTNAIALGRSKLRLQNPESDGKSIWIEEPLNETAEVYIRKKVLLLLPGEKLNIHNSTQPGNTKSWTLRVRAAAVTQDRLDAPLPLLTGLSNAALAASELDPRGQYFDIQLPNSGGTQGKSPVEFIIEWPASNSGLLIVDGFKPSDQVAAGGSKNHKNLIVHIDNMGASLTALKKTVETIKNLSSEQQGTIFISNAIPTSWNPEIGKEALLSNKNPIDLGATLTSPELRAQIAKEHLLVKRAIQQGGSARKIILNSGLSCNTDCNEKDFLADGSSEFTTTMVINRNEEFESTKRYIRNDEFITHPGLLYVEINNPPETLRLNAETKDNSKASFITWFYSGLLKPFGFINPKLQYEEKTAQIDNWLSRLMESFLVTSHSANIAIVLHDNSNPLNLGQGEIRGSITRGEILLHLNELNDKNAQRDDIHPFDEPVSSLSAMRIFGRHAFPLEKISEIEKFIPELKTDALAVSQLQHGRLITLTPSGWLIDPVNPNGPEIVNYMAVASPEKVHEIQEISNKSRQRNRLTTLNIAFPALNQNEEMIDASITTSLKPLGCESRNEDVQIRVIQNEVATTEKKIQLSGKRMASSVWHINCVFEGRIATSSFLKLRFSINNESISRDFFRLGEYMHPVRGFLWHSPDSLELTGAQILDATSALSAPELSSQKQAKVVIWTDRFPIGMPAPKTTLALAQELNKSQQIHREQQGSDHKFSERK